MASWIRGSVMKREPQPDEQIVDVSVLEPPALGPIVATAPTDLPRDYWSIVGHQFRRNRIAVAGLAVIAAFFVIALLADFIANDKPLVMIYQGKIYFPVIKDYAVWLHLSRWQREFQNISYKDFVAANFKAGDWVFFPPIRYSQDEPDLE